MRTRIQELMIAAALMQMFTLACSDDSAGSDSTSRDRQMNIAGLEGNLASGERIFGETCGEASCHGPDGDSGPAPDFSRIGRQFNDAIIASIVLNGFGDMPAQDQLSDQEIADVLAWIDESFRND